MASKESDRSELVPGTRSAPYSDSGSDDDTSTRDPLDLKDDEGWEDVEPDVEDVTFVSLFDDKTFPDLKSMLDYVKNQWSFDLLATRRDLNLDFLETIKLVNYVRRAAKAQETNLDVSSKERFAGEKYLEPALEGDAVLYSLGDLEDDSNEQADSSQQHEPEQPQLQERITELEKQLRQAMEQITRMQELAHGSYQTMAELPESSEAKDKTAKLIHPAMSDEGYFGSYDFSEIHEVMLKDTIRTNAYRDFIYDNKELFQGKTVLDIGCGTGILSMMCAKAGAKRVFAVDNSAIIEKARVNIFDNGLDSIITCVHGKIEEVVLPDDKIDIIVSEWMGYGLLFEGMLDSVLFARDKYLKLPPQSSPDGAAAASEPSRGLLAPSHATLHVAPVADPELINDRFAFWHDVYGFRMDAMLSNAYDDARVLDLRASAVVGEACAFLELPLHSVTVAELRDFHHPFALTISEDVEALDAFVVWFDIFFAKTNDAKVPKHAVQFKDGVAFTTSPAGTRTHWSQAVLPIRRTKAGKPLKKGHTINGTISYLSHKDQPRTLDIKVEWSSEGESGNQAWHLT